MYSNFEELVCACMLNDEALCIAHVRAGDVVRAPTGLMHGKTSLVYHTNIGILEGMEK